MTAVPRSDEPPFYPKLFSQAHGPSLTTGEDFQYPLNVSAKPGLDWGKQADQANKDKTAKHSGSRVKVLVPYPSLCYGNKQLHYLSGVRHQRFYFSLIFHVNHRLPEGFVLHCYCPYTRTLDDLGLTPL